MTLQELYDEPIPDSARIFYFKKQSTLNEDEYKRDKILKFLADKFSEFENREDMHVSEVHMPLEDYVVFKNVRGYHFDPCCGREAIVNPGYIGDLWNAKVKISNEYKSIELI